MADLTANSFINALSEVKSRTDLQNVQRFFRDNSGENDFIGVRMSAIFELSKKSVGMPTPEIKKLLRNNFYEARMGAVSIMDFQARNKQTPPAQKKALFDLYIKNHDKINNWDLVDRSAPSVVGGYLFDRSRAILYKLAKSKNVWERRTAIVSTYFFIRQDDTSDTFHIAEILLNDQHDLIQKAVGSWIREAGKRNRLALLEFLDAHAAQMPRVTLRYAIEKLDKKEKDHYLKKR